MPIRRGLLPFVALLIPSEDLHRLHHHHRHHRQPVQMEMVALLDHRRPLTEVATLLVHPLPVQMEIMALAHHHRQALLTMEVAALLVHQPTTVPLLLLLMEAPLLHLPVETLLPLQPLAPLAFLVIPIPTLLPIQELQELLPTIQDAIVAHLHLLVKDPPTHSVQPMVPLPPPQRLLITVCGRQRPLAAVLLPLRGHRRGVIDLNPKTTCLKGVHLE